MDHCIALQMQLSLARLLPACTSTDSLSLVLPTLFVLYLEVVLRICHAPISTYLATTPHLFIFATPSPHPLRRTLHRVFNHTHSIYPALSISHLSFRLRTMLDCVVALCSDVVMLPTTVPWAGSVTHTRIH